ncbi:TPA: M6 family metalloprotease domain-containing protein [Vibrio vulnificus]|nr:M6 family metalloprotease domain-containing protein [Vibrio vulnificus]HAS6168505.1 M6 family metalloprotease domain-containing protein [Vibrio vulnificus]
MNKWLIFTLALALSASATATVPPAPIWHDVELSDGSATKVRLTGNADFHWYEDEQGNALIEQQDTWFFAEIKNDGAKPYLISSGDAKLADSQPPLSAQDRSALQVTPSHASLPERPVTQRSRSLQQTPFSTRSAFASRAQPFEQPLLVVQVSFSNISMDHDFTELVFSDVNQSVVDYYDKNSFGQYRVVPAQETYGTANDGVISIRVSQQHPNCHDSQICTNRLNSIFSEAYRLIDQYVDFSTYDLNRDGSIDPTELSVMFVFAGGDRSTGVLTKPAIWPHMYFHNTVYVDGKHISAYCLFADYQVNHQSTLGVIVHELGHLMLDLPDLYSYNHKGSVGSWGVMGAGSWAMKEGDLYAGETPVNMSAWSRHAAGFINPQILTSSDNDVQIVNQQAAIVNLDPYLQEFGPRLYVENRRKQDYDRALTAEGVLVTSVNINHAFNHTGPMQVQIMQADGLAELENGGWTDGADVYPGDSQNSLISDNSHPSLTSITGFATGVSLNNIASSDAFASFLFRRPVEGYDFAWMTSLRRSYVVSEAEKNSAAFAVTLSSDSVLEGVQLYYQVLNALQPVEYVVASYPVSNANFASLVLNPAERIVLAQGSTFGNGRLLFDAPAKLAMGSHTLVIELTNAQLEQNYQFSELQNMEPEGSKTIWLGNSQTSSSDGMNKLLPYHLIPFAALLDRDISELLLPVNDRVEVSKNGSLQLMLTSNDRIDATLAGQVEVHIVTQPQHGRLGGLTYTAPSYFVGSDRFSYRLQTADGRMISDVANVEVVVVGDNVAPVVNVDVQASQLIAGQRVQLNGTTTQDPDGDPLNYQWRQTFGPSVSLSGTDSDTAQFTIPASARMGDVFAFTLEASDPSGLSHSDHVQIVIVNTPPVAQDDHVSVKVGERIDITPLANDSDHDGQTLQVTQVSQPTFGSVSLIDNQIRYQAPEEMASTSEVALHYTVSDSEGATAQGRVMITVSSTTAVVASSSSSGSSGGGIGGVMVVILGLLGVWRTRNQNH